MWYLLWLVARGTSLSYAQRWLIREAPLPIVWLLKANQEARTP